MVDEERGSGSAGEAGNPRQPGPRPTAPSFRPGGTRCGARWHRC
jgi:hypothetical protein